MSRGGMGFRKAMLEWSARGTGESGLDHALRLLVAVVVLVFPAVCLLINRSDSLSLLILGLIGLWIWIRNGFRARFERSDWLFVAAFAGFFFVVVLAFEFGHQTDEGFRLLGRYLRCLFVLPVLLALRRFRPPAAAVWGGLGLGALLLGLDAMWESLDAHGILRPNGDTNVAILFGDLATLTSFAFAAGYMYIDGRLPRLGPILVAIGVLMGLLAAFLSGTRGAWVAMPVLLVLFLSCRHLLHPRTVLWGTATVVALFCLLVYLPGTQMLERIRLTAMQVDTYWEANRDADRPSATAHCLDSPGALHTWIDTGNSLHPDGASFGVMKLHGSAAAGLEAWGCSQGAVVYIANKSKEVARMVLPRYVFGDKTLTTTTLLMKGTADAGFAASAQTQEHVEVAQFTARAFSGPARFGNTVDVVVRPGDTVWFVPVESYVGEYQYTLLNNPIAKRLEMWRAALSLFSSAPVLGVGTGAYQIETGRLVKAGQAAPESADFDHPHNEYFDALANRGLVGLLALLALLGVPAWLYTRRLESRDPHIMGAALGGLLVTVGFAIFGLTETMFIHTVTIGWYVIMTSVFLVSMDAPQGQDTGKR